MEVTKTAVDELVLQLENLGIPVDQIKDKIAETKKMEFRGPQTKREEKVYEVAEKILDRTFVGYGKLKTKTAPVVNKGVEKVKQGRSWLGGIITKLGQKIEPK